jgi:hypothetical protein
MPTTVAEVEAMSWHDMKAVFAIAYAQAKRVGPGGPSSRRLAGPPLYPLPRFRVD